MIFSVDFTEAKPIHTKGKNSSEISRKAKIIGGASAAVVAASALVAGVYWGCCSPLRVLIIGGDEATRNDLIETLRNNDSHPETLSGVNPTELMVREIARKKHRNGMMIGVHDVDNVRNWRIRSCDANDPNAGSLVKGAHVIIAILTDKESTDTIHQVLRGALVHRGANGRLHFSNRVIFSVVDESFPIADTKLNDVEWVRGYFMYRDDIDFEGATTLADIFARALLWREDCFIRSSLFGGYSYPARFNDLPGFYWNRSTNAFHGYGFSVIH